MKSFWLGIVGGMVVFCFGRYLPLLEEWFSKRRARQRSLMKRTQEAIKFWEDNPGNAAHYLSRGEKKPTPIRRNAWQRFWGDPPKRR